MPGLFSKPLPALPSTQDIKLQVQLGLPNEIWLKIARELSPADTKRMFSLNRLFYNLYMDEQYGSLRLVSTDGAELAKIMERLQVSEVARRVRTLTLWSESVFEAIHPREGKGKRGVRNPGVPMPPTAVGVAPGVPPGGAQPEQPGKSWKGLKRLFVKKRALPEPPVEAVPAASPLPVQNHKRSKPPPPYAEGIEGLLKTLLSSLPGVEEVSIKYHARRDARWDDHRLDELRRFVRQMRDGIWSERSGIKKTVQKLSFDVDEASFNDLAPILPNIPPNVRHFGLKLLPSEPEFWDAEEETKRDAVASDVVTFVRYLNDRGPQPNQLETISLQTGSRGVWNAIYSLSNLLSLELRPSGKGMMCGPRHCGIHHFLVAAPAGIQHLSLIGGRSKTDSEEEEPEDLAGEDLFDYSAWRYATADFRPFKFLTSLKIRLPVRAEQCGRMLKYLALLAPNLESLAVQNSIGSCQELTAVLGPFTFSEERKGKLRELSVRVRTLTPDVLKCIFSRCTSLGKLRLVYEVLRPLEDVEDSDVCGELGNFQLLDTFDYNEAGFHTVLNKQVNTDRSLFLCDSLKDISFMTFTRGEGTRYDLELMKIMANHFRGIEKFAGIQRAGITRDALERKDSGRRTL
ncbi:hypothetical protein EST38_g5360 [Candolleomyces aberdarensis]|uniref:F-box domain-containing protein n=1 Tax=Candolleomyces aberdarensis TaxID=2316362 RepID=A0A4Q2DKN4_9AGAR|nr:hypothetical protein EST38_g5360 [Candolleomyces aberdarensis]